MAATATAAAPVAVGAELEKALEGLESGLASVVQSIASSVAEISASLRTMEFDEAGSTNSFGDDQLQADIHADEIIFKHLRSCPAVASASSEEQSDILPMSQQQQPGQGYSVAFDPLDGSSIFDANFAVGSIFGVWPGSTPLGQTGRDQVAAAYSVYGPRTLLVLAVPSGSRAAAGGSQPQHCDAAQQQQQDGQQQQQHGSISEAFDVLEFVLSDRRWRLRRVHTKLGDRNNVAPANIRAAAGNEAYQQLLHAWITNGCKLRYSGGMVPDVHHMLAKGGGVFCNPKSATAPAKLRLLYECAPVALVVEAAGGVSHDGQGSILDLVINDTSARAIIALGSAPQVAQCLDAMRGA